MIETLQLEEVVPVVVLDHDAPKLLVEWSSRWQEFRTSIKPALTRSESRLAGEAPFGLIPFRIMIPSYVLEAFLIMAAIFVKVKIDELRPYVAPRFSPHDVIYYSGDELPRTEDLGGAQSGVTGRAGGNEAYHRSQTIKIARGGALVPKVVDAPNLKLPSSSLPVANLLAIAPNPGPPPTEGMRSARSTPKLAARVVAPAPNVIPDYTRNAIQLNSVVAPPPNVTRDRTLAAPSLNATLIAPPPAVSNDHTLVAPRLAPAVIPPAPRVTRDRTQAAPSLNATVVAPAPSVASDQLRSSQTLAANVVPPAPGTFNREMSSAPVRMTDTNVVPPPVSAPERASSRTARLTMPAPAVVAPPPSANVSGDMRRIPTGSAPDPSAVVPPPPTATGSGSFVSSLIGKIFGATEVVPPPPSVNTTGSNTASHSLGTNVLPPPPSMSTGTASGTSNGDRTGLGSTLDPNVVAPPPSVGVSGGTRASAPALGAPSVVPPPPSLTGSARTAGTELASNVVAPPPSLGGGTNATGSGLGRKGVGLGAPLNAGSNLAPPTNGGSGSSGAVMSTQPGPRVGLPTTGGTGSLAMSPGGGDKTGLGGSAGGTGIGAGNGSGSGMNGNASGAAKTSTGHGSDPSARGGISTTAGPGGAGSVPAGNPPARGVDISGGTGIVNLPSFGSDPAGSRDPASPGRSAFKHGDELGVTVVATANSGGAFEPYKNLLRGEKYTTYISTSLGTVVMEFADQKFGAHAFGSTLTAPAAIRTDLAEGLPHARMVVTCTLDASGNVTNIHVLEAGPAGMTAKIVAALRSWKFQPATRNNQPVEVTAILGFGIDTNDRF